jgi:hypothetical protein
MARHTKSRTTTEVKKQPQQTPASKEQPKQKNKGKSKYSAANTANFYYFSKKDMIADCKNDKEKIEKACNDTEENNEKSKESTSKAEIDFGSSQSSKIANKLSKDFKKAVRSLDGVGKVNSNFRGNDDNKWLENHCTGLWNKPSKQNSAFKDFRNQINDKLNSLITQYSNIEKEALNYIVNFVDNYIEENATKHIKNSVNKAAQNSVLAKYPIILKAAQRYNLYDLLGKAIGITAAAYVTGDIDKNLSKYEALLFEASENILQAKLLTGEGAMQDAMAMTMASLAKANPCISARKCLLIPKNRTDSPGSVHKGSSCCPGQTGHHILPDAMFKGRKCWHDKTPQYNTNDAPTICLEGTTHTPFNGTHGLVHHATSKALNDDLKKAEMTYEDAKDKIVSVIAKAFGCNEICLKKQLDDYYDKVHSCKGQPKMVTPKSGIPYDTGEQDGNKTD